MNIINVSNATKEFNGEVLFKNVSFDINDKDKVAIIGKNGAGKSTLIKMIIGDLDIDFGTIYKNNKTTIGYLSQDVISNQAETLYAEMHNVFHELIKLETRINLLTDELATNPHDQELLEKYAKTEHIYKIKGGYEYLYKIDLILTKFGFTKAEYDRNISTFSGGEKTRVAFAKLLLMNPELLILDEPTNHLDIDIIEWLESYLMKYNGAVIVVTHDKYFISKVCKKIVEIDQKTSHIYYGSFEQYEDEKISRYELQLKKYTRQQKEIAHLQSFVDRFRYNSKRASIAKDRVKKINRIDKLDKPHLSNRKVVLNFDGKRTTSDIILEAKDLSIGYDKPLVSKLSFYMRGYDKLAIIGPNGTGKTTLLKVIEKKLTPLKGRVDFLRDYKIGYFDQNQSELNYHKTVFQEIHDYYPMYTNYDIRSIAARFLFYNEDLEKPISILSGGERVRLVLLLLMLEKPDLLILDEPTNHLDIETKDIVEDVFNEFSGPIIFVSHDRYFINRIGTRIVHLTNTDCTVFKGSYDDFKEMKSSMQIVKEKVVRKKVKKINKTKEIQKIETQIHNIEEKIKQKEAATFESENYLDRRKINAINDDIIELKNDLEQLFTEYILLAEE